MWTAPSPPLAWVKNVALTPQRAWVVLQAGADGVEILAPRQTLRPRKPSWTGLSKKWRNTSRATPMQGK
ncbi:unnamed protein product, partial [Ectocarpus fasciculatus]